MEIKINSLLKKYIKSLKETYILIKKANANTPALRIANEVIYHDQHIAFLVQVSLKNIARLFTREEILHKNLLHCFSEEDQQKILSQTKKDNRINKISALNCKIISISFDKTLNEDIFDIEVTTLKNGKKLLKLTSSYIKENRWLLMGLDKESLFNVAYSIGLKDILNFYDSIKPVNIL